jgi:L-lactate utilization protein LutC
MGVTAENNQYYKGKLPIIEEFSNQHRALLSTVASRGFCKVPGFLHETSFALEEAGKNKLSALNYQIVAEAIERSLKQTGHNYTQLYKAARIAFELEKQTLLTDLQQEFADMDAAQSLTEEELNRLFVELDIRRIILITTKTTIELELESLKQELTDIDRLTFTNEEKLINEKVVTATAKLAVIPYLEALIEAQGKILLAEEANLPYMEDLIDEKELLIDKKEEIIPLLQEKADEQLKLANVLWEQIAFQKQMLTAAIDKIVLKTDIVDNEVAILDAQILVEDMRQLLIEQRHNLQEDKIDKEKAFLTTDISNLGLIDAQRDATLTQLQNDKVDVRSENDDSEGTILDADIIKAESLKAEKITEEKRLTWRENYTRVADIKESADASATAEVTSKLIHLIGQP